MFFTALGDQLSLEFHKNNQLMLVKINPIGDSYLAGGDGVAERSVTLAEQQQLMEWKIKCQKLEHQVIKLQVIRPLNQR